MTIVGSRPGGGSWKSISRLAMREPRMSQQAIPIPKVIHPRPVRPERCRSLRTDQTTGDRREKISWVKLGWLELALASQSLTGDPPSEQDREAEEYLKADACHVGGVGLQSDGQLHADNQRDRPKGSQNRVCEFSKDQAGSPGPANQASMESRRSSEGLRPGRSSGAPVGLASIRPTPTRSTSCRVVVIAFAPATCALARFSETQGRLRCQPST